MLRALLEVAHAPGDLLGKVDTLMKWGVMFSDEDIMEIELFLTICDPLEKLFSSLNSEKESTLHLVLPIIRVSRVNLLKSDIYFVILECHCKS